MNKVKAGIPYDVWELEKLRSDRELGMEYLKAALESLNNPDERAGGLLALRSIAEAYGGLGVIAKEAGVSRESLYRSLSPKGNPTLKTLVAVLNTMGLSLSVVPQQVNARKKPAKKSTKAARVRAAA